MAQLSVVVPVRDVGRALADQLDALVRQQYGEPWEIVLADNGSTDPTTLDIEHNYARIHASVRVVDASAVPGKSAAVNAGVRAAEGELIAFCDGDDVVAPGWVAALAEALQEHRFVCGPLEYNRLNPPWSVTARGGGPDQVTGPLHIPGGPPWPFALGANIGVRREAHDAVGGYEEQLVYGGEDCDYAWRLAEAGIRLGWEPGAVVHYRNRHQLRAIYRQARSYSAAHMRLQQRWGHVWPVPPTGADASTRRRRAVRTVHRARSRARLGLWLWDVGWQDGYAVGAQAEPVPALPPEAYGRSGHLLPAAPATPTAPAAEG